MMYDMYNPMLSPFYAQPPRQPYQQPPRQEVVKVSGENGARSYQMGPNSSALLLDESGVIVWLVTTDGAGYKTCAPFDITPHQAQPPVDFGDLEARIKKLEEMMQHGTPADPADARPEQRSTYTAYSDAAGGKDPADDRRDQKRR
ncbi:MAG: hypothetical protein J6V15_03680 [Clostridia bacterium]|nr:hypothetical protein [Clostridia bacterium]